MTQLAIKVQFVANFRWPNGNIMPALYCCKCRTWYFYVVLKSPGSAVWHRWREQGWGFIYLFIYFALISPFVAQTLLQNIGRSVMDGSIRGPHPYLNCLLEMSKLSTPQSRSILPVPTPFQHRALHSSPIVWWSSPLVCGKVFGERFLIQRKLRKIQMDSDQNLIKLLPCFSESIWHFSGGFWSLCLTS